MNDDLNDDLKEVRETLQDSALFSPAVTAQIDALRASVHEQLKARGIDPSSENEEYELIWMVAGGTVGQLIASKSTAAMLVGRIDDVERGALAAHLFWSSGISPHKTETWLR